MTKRIVLDFVVVFMMTLPVLGMTDAASEMLTMAGDTYFNNNLMTTHDPHRIFNTDMSGAYPMIVIDMLVYSDLGVINLLPACPSSCESGELCGVSLRGGILMEKLTWHGNRCVARLKSKQDQTVTVSIRNSIRKTVHLKAGTAVDVIL